jgi:predicted kinase
MVCNEAIKVARNEYEGEDRLVFLAASLFHDIGKGVTTKIGKDGNWHSYGHEFEGEKITRLLLWNEDVWLRERICSLVRYHMEIEFIPESEKFLPKLVSMSKAVKNLDMLIALKECDLRGSIQEDEELKSVEFQKLNDVRETAKSLGFLYHTTNVPDFCKFPWQKMLKAKNSGKPITVVVPIGLSGAGKSTWIAENYPDAVVISRDTIREELGYVEPGQKAVLSRQKEDHVSAVFNQRLTDAARDGSKTIVLDNLNLKKKYRDAYKEQLSPYAVNWVYAYVEAKGLQTNFERRKDDLDMDVLTGMVMSFDWPRPDEYDKFGIFTNGETPLDLDDIIDGIGKIELY